MAAPVAVAPGAEAAIACPRIQIFGVRGSGETVTDYSGYGRTVYTVIQQVKGLIGADAVGRTRIDYPAIKVNPWDRTYPLKYKLSVDAGKTALKSAIDVFLAGRCNELTDIVLIGYSQGAQVAGDVYQALAPDQRSRVIAVTLIGDPRFKGSGAEPPNFGDYSSSLNGVLDSVGAPRVFASTQYSWVRSYCVKGDPVCNFSLTNAAVCQAAGGACVHTNYFYQGYGARTYTQWAAAFIAKQANAYAPAPSSNWTRTDPAGDVSIWHYGDPVIAAPERTAGDITSMSVEASATRVRFVFKFRDLPEWDPVEAGFHVGMVQGDKQVGAEFYNASKVTLASESCVGHAPAFSVSQASKQIVVNFPDRCLEGMRYFKAYAYSTAISGDSMAYFVDDANRTGHPVSDQVAYSPVIYRW